MNEPTGTMDPAIEQPARANGVRPAAPAAETHPSAAIAPPAGCPTCGGALGAAASPNGAGTPSFVYAIGSVEHRFPNLAVEKEFAQATGRAETAGKTDRAAFHAVLSKRESRYLARQLCWVLTVQGLETYLLVPRDPADLDLLVEAIRPATDTNEVDAVIGRRGPIAPPEMCNGLMLPIVAFDQIYSFNRDALVKAIPKPDKVSAAQFAPAAKDLFNSIMLLTDNAGATDEHRAVNYLAMRYPAIYAKTAEQYGKDCSLSGVEVRRSSLSATRNIVDVVFSYTHRQTDVDEKHFVRVDVTEEFPFLVTKMSPYYDR
jgi:PatG C-terminal